MYVPMHKYIRVYVCEHSRSVLNSFIYVPVLETSSPWGAVV